MKDASLHSAIPPPQLGDSSGFIPPSPLSVQFTAKSCEESIAFLPSAFSEGADTVTLSEFFT